jgi:IMP dehydrogenase/GMP reductase
MGPKNKTPAEVKERILQERNSGRPHGKIAEGLNEDGVPTQNGKKWYASTVKNIVDAAIVGESKDEV